MKGWMAALGTTCAWASPGLMLVAIVLALLDLTVAAQQWATPQTQPKPPALVGTVVATVTAEGCSPTLAPELRNMIGRD